MHETPVRREVVSTHPEQGETHRRIAEEPYDFSQVDFSQAEIRQAITGAYRVFLKYRLRCINSQKGQE